MVENEPFCQSPSELYDKMVGDPTNHFTWEVFGSEGERVRLKYANKRKDANKRKH